MHTNARDTLSLSLTCTHKRKLTSTNTHFSPPEILSGDGPVLYYSLSGASSAQTSPEGRNLDPPKAKITNFFRVKFKQIFHILDNFAFWFTLTQV